MVGPQGEVISYEKKGNSIHIRLCAKNTLTKEIESDSGCPLAEGASEVVLNEQDFRDLVSQKLEDLDPSTLSQKDRALLEKFLTDLPNLDEERRKLAKLEAQLQKNQAFKAENPNDYDAKEERKLKAQIQCTKDGLSGQADIIEAKNQVDGIVHQLIQEMDGKPVKRVLKHSADGQGIAFNLLKEIASVDACSSVVKAKADQFPAVGTGCVTSKGVYFHRVKDTASGETGWKDSKGKIWFDTLETRIDQRDAVKFCQGTGKTLPSKTDFELAEKHGIREVMPDARSKWFWSSTVHPDLSDYAYGFEGYNGDIDYVIRSYDGSSHAARCVSVAGAAGVKNR